MIGLNQWTIRHDADGITHPVWKRAPWMNWNANRTQLYRSFNIYWDSGGDMKAIEEYAQATSAQDVHEIGVEAYIYLYPLVMMDVTRRQLTNIEAGKMVGRGPMNRFSHVRAFPRAEFKEVVRPNFDTLYSSGWLDLTEEPMIVSVPDTYDRYYLLPMLDMWTDVFAVPGKRTSGTKAGKFGVIPPNWPGDLPAGVEKIQSPTPYAWIIGRIQTNGPGDYAAVNRIQDGFTIVSLSQMGEAPHPVKQAIDTMVDMKTAPLDQVNKMPAAAYFKYAAELMKVNPPHVTDWSTITRLKRIGLDPGKSFELENLDPATQRAMSSAAVDGLKLMYAKLPTLARVVNGWQMNTDSMGVYGNYYLKRAIVAMVGLGANQPNDAIYPLNLADADGKALLGENSYILHFSNEQLPPMDAFWSITMYDGDGFQVANSLNRFAIGGRDQLNYNADGSLDLYIQHANPGPEREPNWLPSPEKGILGVTMRLYAPRLQALDGRWIPPAVQRIEGNADLLPQ
jgi:hypothetical protein